MAQIDWAGDIGGNFDTAANWTGGVAPGADDDADLGDTGTAKYVVTVSSTGTVSGIETAVTATLEISATAAQGGFEATMGSGGGVNAGAITVMNGGDFIFGGDLDSTGRINLSASTSATELTVGAATATLSGAGSLKLSDNALNVIAAAASGDLLINDGNDIAGAGTISGGGLVLDNTSGGRIDATGLNALVVETTGTLTNSAILEATNPGALAATGGLLLEDTIDNFDGVIEASGAATHVDLQSTAIIGGALKTLTGGVIDTVDSGSTLDGVTHAVSVEGDLTIGNGTALTLEGSVSVIGADSGEIVLASSGSATQLIIATQGARLAGSGQVVLGDNAGNAVDAVSGGTLTNFAATISGAGTIGGGGLVLVNDASGVIDASGAANALVLYTGADAITNKGLIEATGAGGLVIDSNVKQSGKGEIKLLDGATMSLNNASITGGGIVVGSGSDLALANFSLTGVTLSTTGSGVITAGGGTLDGGSNAGDITVKYGTNLNVEGIVDNAGVISLITDNNGGENGTNIVLLGSTTFDGGGDVYMGGTSPWDDFLEGSYRSAGFTLTNVNETFSGAGSIGNTSLGVGPLKIVNEAHGVIDGDNATQQLVISTGGYTVANAGIMEGTAAGGLNIEAAVDNTGTIRAAWSISAGSTFSAGSWRPWAQASST